jgi:hypothetical protein
LIRLFGLLLGGLGGFGLFLGDFLFENCLRCGQLGDRYAERATAYIVEADLVTELDRVRLTAVLAANSNLEV